jgi:hypothetical protein
VRRVPNPFDPGYFISAELRQMGFARVGENSAISRTVGALGDRDRPLGILPQRQAGNAEIGGLLLDAAAVGDRGGAPVTRLMKRT